MDKIINKENEKRKIEKDIMNLKEQRARFVYENSRLHAAQLGCENTPEPWDECNESVKEYYKDIIFKLCNTPTSKIKKGIKKYFLTGGKKGKEYDPKEKAKNDALVGLIEIAKYCIW